MSEVDQSNRGSFMACDGWPTLPIARVVVPHLRRGNGPDAVLLMDDPGDPTTNWSGRVWTENVRNSHVQTTDGLKVINPLTTYTPIRPVDPAPAGLLPAFMEVEFANLGGDLEGFNGVHVCQMANLDLGGGASRTFYHSMTADLYIATIWTSLLIDRWDVYLALEPGILCLKRWQKSTTMEDIEGSYRAYLCGANACNNVNTCSLSSSATCRVRWAGATWL